MFLLSKVSMQLKLKVQLFRRVSEVNQDQSVHRRLESKTGILRGAGELARSS